METSTHTAPPVDLDRLVSRWVDTAIRVQDTFGKIENAFMASPENEIRAAIWDMFGEYTRTLAAQLSDDAEDAEDARGWLEWFAWECDFGRKPMEMVFADGENLMVVDASDLLAAIRTDKNGCRVWDSTDNAKSAGTDAGGKNAMKTEPTPTLAAVDNPRLVLLGFGTGRTHADEIKSLGLKVGDTIRGKEGGNITDHTCWEEVRLTVLWIGEKQVVYRKQWRMNHHPDEWHDEGEVANFTLSCREYYLEERLCGGTPKIKL